MRRLVGWARTQAEAALRQAGVTQQIFQAAHRPYVEARIGPEVSFFNGPDNFGYRFYFKNHGPVPAILTGWRAIVRHRREVVAERAPDEADAGISLFTGESRPVEFRRGTDNTILDQGEVSEVEVVVEYRGLNEARYVSRVVYSGRFQSWRKRIEQIT